MTEADLVDTATSTGTANAVSNSLPNGYYYITTSTGTVVTINSTNPSATVNDKNTIPSLDKKAKQAADPSYMEIDAAGHNAIAQVGKVIPFEVTIDIETGAKGYVFHDKMDAGLTYQNDLAVKVGDAAESAGETTYDATAKGTDTITVTFVDAYLKANEGKTITITYSAKVSSAALQTNPAKNTATLSYGDNNGYDTDEVVVNVYNAKLDITKKDGDEQPLAGAGFVIATEAAVQPAEEGDGTENPPAEDASGDEGEENEDTEAESAGGSASLKYYKLVNGAVTWVDNIEDADVHTSAADGKVPAFTGLGNGTYTIIEKVVPAGYNKAADQTFTVSGSDYTAANLEQEAEVVNNVGSTLPSTGGIGTTIFYVVGAILVIGAGVVMITRRRMDA